MGFGAYYTAKGYFHYTRRGGWWRMQNWRRSRSARAVLMYILSRVEGFPNSSYRPVALSEGFRTANIVLDNGLTKFRISMTRLDDSSFEYSVSSSWIKPGQVKAPSTSGIGASSDIRNALDIILHFISVRSN